MIELPEMATQERKDHKYTIRRTTPDKVAALLALESIATFPQMRNSVYLIADHLLRGVNKKNALSISQAYEAKLDPVFVWAYTRYIHALYGVGTDRQPFRDPAKPDSPEIYPKNPEWLANFVKGFIIYTFDLIVESVNEELVKSGLSPLKKNVTAQELQRLLETDGDLLEKVRQALQPTIDDTREGGYKRRESLRQRAEEKYGPGGVKYEKI